MSQTIVFDKHGDTKVRNKRVGELEHTVYIVCSRALARVSPVFHAILYDRIGTVDIHKSPQSDDGFIDFVEEGEESLIIFLNIAHARFSGIPRTLNVDQLYNITALTSRYECTCILSTWVNSWISCSEDQAHETDLAKILWVTWQVGRQNAFTRTSQRMAMECDALAIENAKQFCGNVRFANGMGKLRPLHGHRRPSVY